MVVRRDAVSLLRQEHHLSAVENLTRRSTLDCKGSDCAGRKFDDVVLTSGRLIHDGTSTETRTLTLAAANERDQGR